MNYVYATLIVAAILGVGLFFLCASESLLNDILNIVLLGAFIAFVGFGIYMIAQWIG